MQQTTACATSLLWQASERSTVPDRLARIAHTHGRSHAKQRLQTPIQCRLEAQLAARLQALRSLQAGSDGGYGAAAMVLDAHRQVRCVVWSRGSFLQQHERHVHAYMAI